MIALQHTTQAELLTDQKLSTEAITTARSHFVPLQASRRRMVLGSSTAGCRSTRAKSTFHLRGIVYTKPRLF